MNTFVTAAGFALGASAAILPRNDGCCFQLTASGGQSGTLGQLDDGQNRVGGGLGAAQYCINNGQITDGSGRGCILTAPTTQFQCDMGASPDGGFSVSGNGMLQHNGDSTFYACPADEGEYNIYTEKVDNMPKCVEVSLSTGGKCAGGQSMTSPAGGQQTSPAGGQNTCPPAQTVTKTEQGKPTTVVSTKTEQGAPTTVYKTETVQNTQVKPTTVYSTKTEEETETATKPTTVYETKTVQSTVTAQQPTTIYQTKTQEETETATKPTTVYSTSTVQNTVTAQTPTTVYKTSTVEETQTVPTTAYETKTMQNTVTAQTPTTVYKTEEQTETVPTTAYETKTVQNTVTAQTPTTVYKTEEQTETATKPTTVYDTKTIQNTVTAQTPTTVYKTSTVEETQTKPTTAYETKTIQQTETAQQPTTVYNTKTVEETETAKAQPTTITKVQTQVQTQKAPAQTVTKTEQCDQGKPTYGGHGGWGHGKPTQGGGKPSPTSQGSACPTDLSGSYETPHLIVPVNSEHPDQSYGTSYNGMMNSSASSIYNFDIPQSYEGQTCSLVFMLPKKADLETSDYTLEGQGSISVDRLSSPCKESTTWNSAPQIASHAGDFSPQPGNSYVVMTDSCAAGSTQSYELSASGGLDLNYFQDYNPSPIGLYITTC